MCYPPDPARSRDLTLVDSHVKIAHFAQSDWATIWNSTVATMTVQLSFFPLSTFAPTGQSSIVSQHIRDSSSRNQWCAALNFSRSRSTPDCDRKSLADFHSRSSKFFTRLDNNRRLTQWKWPFSSEILVFALLSYTTRFSPRNSFITNIFCPKKEQVT